MYVLCLFLLKPTLTLTRSKLTKKRYKKKTYKKFLEVGEKDSIHAIRQKT